jgi:Zn-dependent protease
MDFGLSPEQLRIGLITYIFIAASLCLRAYAQAWLADRLGDRTPALDGRLTLNPLPHVDVLGTVILPLVCIFYLQPRLEHIWFFLAWAKPVPINPAAFTQPRKHYLYCLLAQTAISLLIMLAVSLVGSGAYRLDANTELLVMGVIGINACLVVLDLFPLPPLPGALVLVNRGWMKEETYLAVGRWGGLILLIAFQVSAVQQFFGLLRAIVAIPFLLLFKLLAG